MRALNLAIQNVGGHKWFRDKQNTLQFSEGAHN